ncbi:MAG: DUF3572 domain-containing protein [Pseudomonadota bacterium]
MDKEYASQIAIEALSYIAGDQELLNQFVSLSGLQPDQISQIADTPAFLAAILDFLRTDDTKLLAFSSSRNIEPDLIYKAKITLDPEINYDQ